MPETIRALVVDDEEPARDRLRRLLAEAVDVEVVGEAEDGERAMEQIASLHPTVVFLDIQMPGSTGLEIAASLPSPRPHIVFCTAFDQFAVDAFELHAADYLLKPVTRARLVKALDRVRGGTSDEQAIDRVTAAAPPPMRFLARKGNTYRVVLAREVLCFVSEDGLTKLQAVEGHYWMAPALNALEARLDPRRFFRVSRAAIVNLDAVREVAPDGSGAGGVTLRDGSRLEVSRRRFRELTDRLGGA
jgi:two-component system LytT family response regulator